MAMFAVIKDNKVENIIIADSKAIAEEVTGLTCVEYTHENPARIGLGYSNGVFEQPVAGEITE
jgi:hypothetical protein